MAFYVDAGVTPLAELAKDPRFPWDRENECFNLKVFRGWGDGKIYWSTRVSRFVIEDVAADLDGYLRHQMVHTCLAMQAKEPDRATDPVAVDGNYAIQYRWVRDTGAIAIGGTGYDLIGELVDVSLIDRLVSEIRRARGIAKLQKADRIDRLIKDITKAKEAIEKQPVAQPGGYIVPPAFAEEQVAKMFGTPVKALGKITEISIDENGVNYTAEITEELARMMTADLDRSFVFGSKPVSFDGINLNPGDTLKIAPKLTFDVLEEWRRATLDSWIYGNGYIANGRRVDPRTVRMIVNPITSY